MRMSNETYDKLKFIVTVILPAIGTLYFALSEIWHLPYGQQIVGTIAAVVTFLGVCLKISTNNYNKSIQDIVDSITEDDTHGEGL